MRIKLLMPVLAVVVLQSCANRVEETGAAKATETVNTNVPVENTYTGAEPAAASPDINNEAAATAVTTGNTNNKAANNATAYTTRNNRVNTGNRTRRTKSTTPVVQTESAITPGFKASYQVPANQYSREARAARERTNGNIAYQRVQIKQGNMRASYDMPGDDYRGEDVLSHDGVDKNLERNVNYLDFTGGKVPNDGGQPYKD